MAMIAMTTSNSIKVNPASANVKVAGGTSSGGLLRNSNGSVCLGITRTPAFRFWQTQAARSACEASGWIDCRLGPLMAGHNGFGASRVQKQAENCRNQSQNSQALKS